MSFLDLALSRESTRNFTKGAPVSREDLELCVKAARLAPSACNSQPWKFVIIDDAGTVKKIADAALTGPWKMNDFALSASAFIAIVSEKTKPPAWAGGKLMRTDFRLIDTGIACAHVVLAAEDLGISTCILGWFGERQLKKILGIPRHKKVEILIPMGYSACRDKREKKRKPREETVSFNRY